MTRGPAFPRNVIADLIAVRGDVLRYPNLLADVDLVVKGGRVIE